MPGRIYPLVNGEIYHVINRGISGQPVFLNKRDYNRALETLFYYQNIDHPVKYSRFMQLPVDQRKEIKTDLAKKRKFSIEILAYCLMPNHFHLILKQIVENGISQYIANITNSYTKYFNLKNERYGPLFKGRFKSIRIETEEQLLHLSRYIHLNPYTAYLIRNIDNLINYNYSSFPEYLGLTQINYCTKDLILGQFKKNTYKDFVFDQANYQRELNIIKHLALEA